jgi:uncharacterized protein involved in exopolysaccharide biosynthesis
MYARRVFQLLAKQPATLAPGEIDLWRRRALASMAAELAEHGQVPSDAPANVLVVAIELEELRERSDQLAVQLGPKHPQMVRLRAQIADAEAALRGLVVADAPQRAEPDITGEMVVRRARLAARSRAMRKLLHISN